MNYAPLVWIAFCAAVGGALGSWALGLLAGCLVVLCATAWSLWDQTR